MGLFADGSAAAPSIAFLNDPDTGMYRTGANSLTLVAGGTVNDRIVLSVNGIQFYCGGASPQYQMNNNSVHVWTGSALLRWDGRTIFSSPTNGNIIFQSANQTDFGLMIFGAATSSYPALKRSTTTLECRLADDSGVASLVSNGATLREGLLASATGIDLSLTTKQTLYTVPAGKVCYPTRFVVRDASAAITLATVTIGFDAGATDVVGATALTGLSDGTKYQILSPVTNPVEGAAAAVLGLDTTVQEGAADTVTIDVYGFLV